MNITITRNGQTFGPYGADEVNRLLKAEVLSAADLAWQEGMEEWKPLGTLPGIYSAVASQAPPLPQTGDKGDELKKKIIAGYSCAGASLIFLPIAFGIAGLVMGIIVLTKGRTEQGAVIIALSVVCGTLGTIISMALFS